MTQAQQTIRIMPLGDSNTEGYPQMQGGYRLELWNKLTADGFPVEMVGSMTDSFLWAQPHHEGHSGWTINDLDSQVVGWITNDQPDIILLMIGTNDILTGQQEGMTVRLETLIDDIFTARPNVRLIVAQILPIAEASLNQQVDRFNASIPALVSKKAAQGSRITLINLNSPFTFVDLIDGVHMTPAAANRMGDLWYETVATLLRNPFQLLTPALQETVKTAQYEFLWTQGTPDEAYKIKIKAGDYKFSKEGIAPSACVDGICRTTIDFSKTPLPYEAEMNMESHREWSQDLMAGLYRENSRAGTPTATE